MGQRASCERQDEEEEEEEAVLKVSIQTRNTPIYIRRHKAQQSSRYTQEQGGGKSDF